MELEREHFRAMILYDFKSGLNESQTLERLTQAFGNLAPSRAIVFRWFPEFKTGRTSLEDEERSGRPTSVVTEENFSAVESLTKDDPHRNYKDIVGVKLLLAKALLLKLLSFVKDTTWRTPI